MESCNSELIKLAYRILLNAICRAEDGFGIGLAYIYRNQFYL